MSSTPSDGDYAFPLASIFAALLLTPYLLPPSPHMQRLYGNAVRKDAGVTKTFKGVASKQTQRAPPQVKKAVKEFQGTLERVYDDTSLAVEEFLRRCKGREDCLSTPWIAIHSMQLSSVVFTAAPRFSDYVENTKVLLKEQGERLLIT